MATHSLPICHTPLLNGYLRHAYLFSILGTRGDYLAWALSGDYTQLVCDTDPAWMPLDFYAPQGYIGTAFACPFLDTQWLDRIIIGHGFESASVFLEEVIAQGYYAAFAADEYHVPGRAAHGRSHFLHRVLVFAVDGNRFSIMGYDAAGKYGSSFLDRAQMDKAFFFAAGSKHEAFDGTGAVAALKQCTFSQTTTSVEPNRIWLVRHLPERAHCIDPDSVLAMLSDYLNGTDTSARYRMIVNYPNKVPPLGHQIKDPSDGRRVYGIRVYEALVQ